MKLTSIMMSLMLSSSRIFFLFGILNLYCEALEIPNQSQPSIDSSSLYEKEQSSSTAKLNENKISPIVLVRKRAAAGSQYGGHSIMRFGRTPHSIMHFGKRDSMEATNNADQLIDGADSMELNMEPNGLLPASGRQIRYALVPMTYLPSYLSSLASQSNLQSLRNAFIKKSPPSSNVEDTRGVFMHFG